MKKSKMIFIYILFIFIFFILSKPGSGKYLVSIILLSILFIEASNKNILSKKLIRLTMIFIVPSIYIFIYTLIIILINQDLSFFNYTIKQVILMIIPIITSYSITILFGKKMDIPKLMFISTIIVFLLNNIAKFELNYFMENLFEGTEAFIFGLYLIYFLYRKDKLNFIICLIVMYLAHKRIVLAASIISLAMFYIVNKLKNKNQIIYNSTVYIIVIFTSVIFVYMVESGELIKFFYKYNINDMGRLHLYSIFDGLYEYSVMFKGLGVGYVDKILEVKDLYFGSNLHSDFLKMYIEIGMIGYIFYFIVQYYIYKYIRTININISNLYIYAIIFTQINYFTDNLLIYIYYLIPLYTIILWEVYIGDSN